MKLELKTLSFKKVLYNYNIYEQEFDYGGVLGQAELIDGFICHKFVCYRKENCEETAAISLTEIESKKERQVGNTILKYIGINLRFGNKINNIKEIEKIYGVPIGIDNDFIDMLRYHYLISPDLFICLGIKTSNNKLIHVEIINDSEVISEIIDVRRNDPKDLRQGISATVTSLEPRNPDKIINETGAKDADYYVDIDVSRKKIVYKGDTKKGWPNYEIRDNVSPDDIVGSGRVKK